MINRQKLYNHVPCLQLISFPRPIFATTSWAGQLGTRWGMTQRRTWGTSVNILDEWKFEWGKTCLIWVFHSKRAIFNIPVSIPLSFEQHVCKWGNSSFQFWFAIVWFQRCANPRPFTMVSGGGLILYTGNGFRSLSISVCKLQRREEWIAFTPMLVGWWRWNG